MKEHKLLTCCCWTNSFLKQLLKYLSILSEKHSNSGSKTMEAEKRIRREIANSNERRRMQSINAGFQALRTLLPRHEGEKLSKVSLNRLIILNISS